MTRIRLAESGDEPWLRRLLQRSLAEEYGPLDPEDFADEWHTRIGCGANVVWIADDTTGPIGFAWLIRLPDPLFRSGTYYLYYVAVEAAHRGQGVALALLQHVRTALPGAIRLLVRCDSPAKRLYTRLGAHPWREEWVWPEQTLPGS